jgi:hypothetical protein
VHSEDFFIPVSAGDMFQERLQIQWLNGRAVRARSAYQMISYQDSMLNSQLNKA